MRSLVVSAALAALISGAASAQEQENPPAAKPRPVKVIPSLARAPKLDGNLKDFPATLTIKPPASMDASASFTARVGWRKDILYVGVETTGDQLQAGDLVTLSLFFPDAGPTATGNVFRFAFDGKRASPPESGTSEFAQKQLEAGVQHKDNTLALEVAIPARAFPRFPAEEPLVLDLCVTYDNVSNCKGGGMVGEALRLPDEFRKGLKLKPTAGVMGLEAQPDGWLGYGVLHYPDWVEANEPLTHDLLKGLVAPKAVEAEAAGVNVPETLSLPNGKTLLVVLSGETPYTNQGTCDADKELRLGLYLVKGKTAQRVLEWPAATCALGRATSVVLDEEGALSIGYSNGPTINFAWSGDHFERTELGKR
ncbi:hypothetical protein [Vitiosangium sp. GDMCC 1.1324]|uniref:hypothetical protein n=1 Tax=Vitiosangium sp. (strain GDMCC 1.1324) TaxID=2138576 RepID=UPI000D33AC6B|nr:hypothetical protein [Vitiosangium sp. GDMCC 1.1324]PTL79141.1 hypothetical protein DAT35_36675 [Vitiosangium sp. GDMCC 1.1324]